MGLPMGVGSSDKVKNCWQRRSGWKKRDTSDGVGSSDTVLEVPTSMEQLQKDRFLRWIDLEIFIGFACGHIRQLNSL